MELTLELRGDREKRVVQSGVRAGHSHVTDLVVCVPFPATSVVPGQVWGMYGPSVQRCPVGS